MHTCEKKPEHYIPFQVLLCLSNWIESNGNKSDFALVYFSDPWDIFKLWQHFYICFLEISSKTNLNFTLTLHNQSVIPLPNPAGVHLSQSLGK